MRRGQATAVRIFTGAVSAPRRALVVAVA
ncbi:MAG: hypothetical protein JWN32_3294, partial [Solirubrobacterales bacterium]|nr:hypothetical protein [Solirubrobacterales bacterium]